MFRSFVIGLLLVELCLSAPLSGAQEPVHCRFPNPNIFSPTSQVRIQGKTAAELQRDVAANALAAGRSDAARAALKQAIRLARMQPKELGRREIEWQCYADLYKLDQLNPASLVTTGDWYRQCLSFPVHSRERMIAQGAYAISLMVYSDAPTGYELGKQAKESLSRLANGNPKDALAEEIFLSLQSHLALFDSDEAAVPHRP